MQIPIWGEKDLRGPQSCSIEVNFFIHAPHWPPPSRPLGRMHTQVRNGSRAWECVQKQECQPEPAQQPVAEPYTGKPSLLHTLGWLASLFFPSLWPWTLDSSHKKPRTRGRRREGWACAVWENMWRASSHLRWEESLARLETTSWKHGVDLLSLLADTHTQN